MFQLHMTSSSRELNLAQSRLCGPDIDLAALKILGQRTSYLLEHGLLIKFGVE